MMLQSNSLLFGSSALRRIDPLAVSWATRVVSNGGAAPSAGTVSALSTFCKGIRAQGLLPYLQTANALVPDSLIAAMTPLIYTPGGVTPTERITNGDFSVNWSGWTNVSSSTINIASGGVKGNCVNVTHYPGSFGRIAQAVNTVAGRRYRLVIWHKNGASSGRGYVVIGPTMDTDTIYSGPVWNDANWTRYVVHFTATDATAWITLRQADAASASTMWDEVSVVEVSCDDPWTNVNFVSGDLTVAGLKGNGSNKYLGIGTNWNTLGNTVGLVVYYPEALSSTTTPTEIGVGNTTLNRYVYLRGFSTNHNEFGYGGTALANAANEPSTEHGALQIGSRNGDSSGFITYERQESFVETDFTPIGGWGVDDTPFALFCRNQGRNGTYNLINYSARRISFAAITAGLTKTDGRALYQALYALRSALGGGAV